MVLPAGLSPATTTFEASRSNTLSYGSIEMVGRLGFAPSSRRLRAGTSLSKFATQSRHEGASRIAGRRGLACEDLADTWISHRFEMACQVVALAKTGQNGGLCR